MPRRDPHPPAPAGDNFTARQLLRMLRVPAARLRQWQRAGLFPRQAHYHWQDVLRGRKLAQCGAAHVTARALRRSLAALERHLPEVKDPLLEAGFACFSQRVAVQYGGFVMEALTGQLRLGFDAPATTSLVLPPPGAAPAAAPAQDAEHWFGYGLSLEGQPGMQPQAAAAYRRCIELDPGFGSAYINLGTLCYHQKDFAAAEAAYRQALALDPDYALAYFNLGNVLDETGRLELAIEAYNAAVRLAPTYADAHYNLALAYQRQGSHRRAIPHWKNYLGMDQRSPWANHARAQLKQTLERDPLQVVRA